MTDDARVTIGEAAKLAGVTPKAIRLYEQRGLLEPAARTAAGYRTYGPGEVAVLRFIRQAKAVGLRLQQIAHVIDLQRNGEQPCATVVDLLDARLADIDAQLNDLTALRTTLATARAQADCAARSGRSAVICTVIENAAPAPSKTPDCTTPTGRPAHRRPASAGLAKRYVGYE